MYADPVAQQGRYSKPTLMVELKGWKRFELNGMMVFAGVAEDSFYAVLRRGHVTMCTAHVLDAQIHRRTRLGLTPQISVSSHVIPR